MAREGDGTRAGAADDRGVGNDAKSSSAAPSPASFDIATRVGDRAVGVGCAASVSGLSLGSRVSLVSQAKSSETLPRARKTAVGSSSRCTSGRAVKRDSAPTAQMSSAEAP